MTNPLFIQDLATLKAGVRLTGVPSVSTDTLAILDQAILKARLSFYRRLGDRRVVQLLAIAYDANPTTDDQILRALANTTENNLVYVELLRRLPNQFMDASGTANRQWNEEAPFRERGMTDLQRELLRIETQIEEDMQLLAAEESLSDESSIKTYNGTPTCPPPRPGDSIRGIRRNRFPQD